MTQLAYRKLTRPAVFKSRDHERAVIDRAVRSNLTYKEFTLQVYEWGSGPRCLLLIHGWEGRAANFADLIEPLTTAGFRVIGFDAPAHGLSSRGKTDFFDFTEVVKLLLDRYRPGYLLSHSFGGVATTWALRANRMVSIKRYVLLTTPNRFSERIASISAQVGISDTVQQRLRARVESESDLRIDDLNVADFVTDVPVSAALILHDQEDRVIPISQSRAVADAWPACEMREVTGTGHFRILRTETVTRQVLDFLLER